MNYFELFDLPSAPVVDMSLLSAKYFELQRKNHPDFFTQGTDIEKEDSLTQSADINKAFGILQSKERTIEYFLQLKGLVTTDEKYNLPPDFLMEMMEINEALTDDPTTVFQRVAGLEKSLDEEILPVIKNYNAQTKEEELLKLKEYYYKKKYLNRILDRLGD